VKNLQSVVPSARIGFRSFKNSLSEFSGPFPIQASPRNGRVIFFPRLCGMHPIFAIPSLLPFVFLFFANRPFSPFLVTFRWAMSAIVPYSTPNSHSGIPPVVSVRILWGSVAPPGLNTTSPFYH